MSRITPFVKRTRANGGTIYTITSALQDININISEKNNVVKISNFALLNIPNIAEASLGFENNTFNVRNIDGAWKYEQSSPSVKDGRVLIAESFQNYALNLESNLLNQTSYNPLITNTIAERVFWKWLKETGAIRWNDPSTAGNGITYWQEELNTLNYSEVVQYIGEVTAGNVRIDSFGTYNETYLLIPTSHGQTNAYWKQVEDENYYHNLEIGNKGENILGRETFTGIHPDGLSYLAYYDYADSSLYVGGTPYQLFFDNSTGSFSAGWWYSAEGITPISSNNAYLTDSSNYLNTKIYNVDLQYQGPRTITFRRSKLDCMSLEFNINNLKTIYGDSALNYDSIATQYQLSDSFEFNTVLIYYSVYNSTKDQLLATNLLGVMFLDAPSGNTAEIGPGLLGIELPRLEKIASSSSNGFGTSYSLRLNIKTDNMVDNTQATFIDESTSDQLWTDDWQRVFQNLAISVNILSQQNSVLNYISNQYNVVQGNQTDLFNNLTEVQNKVNEIGRDITGVPGTIAMFSNGTDPLVESSIYMKYGKVGIFNNDPKYGLDIDSSVRMLDLTIQNSIRDASNNILLGYGSPLQLGSTTNFREVEIYTGNDSPAVYIDISNNILLSGDVTITGQVIIDGSLSIANFDFDKTYMKLPQNVGVGLNWDGSTLYVTTPSDRKLKENIKSIGPSLYKILSLTGVEFDFIENKTHHVGFIAQDVELIIPEVVQNNKNFDGHAFGEDFKSIRYEELIPYLVESIKEQYIMIEQLKNEIINLKK